jgi:dUTP pyrophosphatase
MNIKIKRIDKSLPLPQYETDGAVAFDFVAREDTVIEPNGIGRVPTNVVVEVPKGYMLYIKDRSSTAKKKGLLITAGVVDQDYCGDNDEILMQFYNPTNNPITVEREDRLAQGIFVAVGIGEWEEVDSMGHEDRGGFGTTDKVVNLEEPAPEKVHITLSQADSQSIPVETNNPEKGKLIVLYGVNNIGKSTQAKLLVDRLQSEGKIAEYIKFHAYDIQQSGPMINDYLRGGNPYQLWPREFQLLCALNKFHFQPTLEKLLDSGVNVVAEDYWGTGIAWGVGAGVEKEFLERIYSGILKEDVAFLFDGERFVESTEDNHEHETNNRLIQQVRLVHQDLGREYGWITVDANNNIDNIHNLIWDKVNKII